MFTEKRMVIVVAAVLVTCGLLLSNASSIVEAKPLGTATTATPTKTITALTISAPPSAQVQVPFSITSQLTSNGALFTKSATVYLQRLNGNAWTTLASKTATGTYSFSRTETSANTYQYRTTYAGSATSASSTSPTDTVNVVKSAPTPTATATPTPTATPAVTLLSLVVTNATPTVNQSVTLTATLTNGTTPIPSEPVTIYHYFNDLRSNDTATATNQSGQITFNTSWAYPGQFTYYAAFAGDNSYQNSTSTVVTINVSGVSSPASSPNPATNAITNATTNATTTRPQLNPTTITITPSTTTPAVNQSFTLSGTLTAGTTPLSGKTIKLVRKNPSGTWTVPNTTTTGTNGTFTFTRNESQGLYTYQAVFSGDTYAPANASVSLTV